MYMRVVCRYASDTYWKGMVFATLNFGITLCTRVNGEHPLSTNAVYMMRKFIHACLCKGVSHRGANEGATEQQQIPH